MVFLPRFFVEGYGCSLNKADTEAIKGFLQQNGFTQGTINNSDYVVVNTCAVKEQTENRMLKRIRELHALSKKKEFRLIVFGCLPKISGKKISEISKKIVQLPPSLESLSKFFHLPEQPFSPSIAQARSNRFISIIPICRGCLGSCTYCSVKQARGPLKSYSIASLKKKFAQAVKEAPEVWLTAQDLACYGKDIGSSLPELLQELLSVEGNYRVRLGMMNPAHLKPIANEMLECFQDKRLYKFLHLPVQSGSGKILKAMKRDYSPRDFLLLVKKFRSKVKGLTLSTDVIVGFPGETEKDFNATVSLLEKVKPGICNISRFGARPNTPAEKMPQQLHGR
ncbi:MAG: tRNA (N(6)-L-threonylcarbamoyladenosine(37)-C(2))-methylthiotransferase, partial [Candidatus Diapherotrites archaeon]